MKIFLCDFGRPKVTGYTREQISVDVTSGIT